MLPIRARELPIRARALVCPWLAASVFVRKHELTARALCRNAVNLQTVQKMMLHFYNEDIPDMLQREQEPGHKMRHVHSDLGAYLQEVCREITVLYPSASDDVAQLVHLFKISLQQECAEVRTACATAETAVAPSDART